MWVNHGDNNSDFVPRLLIWINFNPKMDKWSSDWMQRCILQMDKNSSPHFIIGVITYPCFD